jgi:hypothetical protein
MSDYKEVQKQKLINQAYYVHKENGILRDFINRYQEDIIIAQNKISLLESTLYEKEIEYVESISEAKKCCKVCAIM